MVNIMLVEDHPGFADALVRVLRSQTGYQPEAVHSAEDALDRLQTRYPDLVLVDLSLPGRNGIWLVKELAGKQPGLPTVVLTGHARKEYLDQSLEAGARGFILKEDLPGLLEGIQTALRGGTYVSQAVMDSDPLPAYP